MGQDKEGKGNMKIKKAMRKSPTHRYTFKTEDARRLSQDCLL